MIIYKDALDRMVILQEGNEPEGDNLAKQAINFKASLTYYNFFLYSETALGNYDLPYITVRTTWAKPNDRNNYDVIMKRDKLINEVAEILYQERAFLFMKLWKWYVTGEYIKDAEVCSKNKLFNKYALSNETKKKVAERIIKIESLNNDIRKVKNENIEEEFITLLSKPDKIYKNGNIEYFTQKGITTEPLKGKDVFTCHREILKRLKESQESNKSLLKGIIESFKEIKDNRGKTVIVLTGYRKVDPKTGFAEGDPSYIEFRIYPPPFRKVTYNKIIERIQEIKKEIKIREGKQETTLPYFKTLEYIQKEKDILEKTIQDRSQMNKSDLIVYLPDILLFHSGNFIESYTYKYDPKKGNEADNFRGLK